MRIYRFLPFTLLMLILVGCAGIYFDSHVGATDGHVHQVAGYSIRLLIEGELQRAATSLFITDGGWSFYIALAMLFVAVGFVEATRGTLRAVSTFFSVHFATLLIVAAIILCCHILEPTIPTHLLIDTRDVGPSAGYYGCLGLGITSLKPVRRVVVVAIIFIVLILRTAHSFSLLPEQVQVLAADLAHLIAFPLGIASACLGRTVEQARSPSTLVPGP